MPKSIDYLSPASLPTPKGHYSPGVAYGGLVFVSGQLPDDPAASFEAQVRNVLRKVELVLQEAGSELSDLLKVTAYIDGIDRWGEFNEIYRDVLGGARPARAVVPVVGLHHGCLIEVEAVGAMGRPD